MGESFNESYEPAVILDEVDSITHKLFLRLWLLSQFLISEHSRFKRKIGWILLRRVQSRVNPDAVWMTSRSACDFDKLRGAGGDVEKKWRGVFWIVSEKPSRGEGDE